jgi:hypothetical protein
VLQPEVWLLLVLLALLLLLLLYEVQYTLERRQSVC